MLEHNVKWLSWGVEGAQYPCLHGCSSRSLDRFKGSLDRCERSLDRRERSQSWHRLERWVTFWDPEVEPDSNERPYKGPQGLSFRTHLERNDGVHPTIQRQETVHPWEIPTAYPDIRSGRGYHPEPSIRNYEVWLDWWAHQLDMPHWWMELTAIPNVENPKRLAQNIHASFLILVVRCEALPGQDYTMPTAPKCLTSGRFLPNDPSYQDVQQKPLLLTRAYARVLQYWVEKIRLPALPDYCPLVMSVVELMQHVRGNVTLDKWDILWNLGRITPESVSQDTVIPQGDPVTQPTTADVRDMESNSTEAQGVHDTTPSLFRHPPKEETPLVEPITLPTEVDVGHTLPSPADTPLERDATVLSTEPMWKSHRTCRPVEPLALSRRELKLFPPLDWWLS